jgi:hypothetical protein
MRRGTRRIYATYAEEVAVLVEIEDDVSGEGEAAAAREGRILVERILFDRHVALLRISRCDTGIGTTIVQSADRKTDRQKERERERREMRGCEEEDSKRSPYWRDRGWDV